MSTQQRPLESQSANPLQPPLYEQSNYRFANRMARMPVSAIRELLKVTEQPEIISFAGGMPAPELFPVAALAEAHANVLHDDGPAALQYSISEGWRPLREWIATRMQRRGNSRQTPSLLRSPDEHDSSALRRRPCGRAAESRAGVGVDSSRARFVQN